MNRLLHCWLATALLLGGCAPKPSQQKVREPVSEKDRKDESEDDPVEAPPPAYGHRVVKHPEERDAPLANEPQLGECPPPPRDQATPGSPKPAPCVPRATLVD